MVEYHLNFLHGQISSLHVFCSREHMTLKGPNFAAWLPGQPLLQVPPLLLQQQYNHQVSCWRTHTRCWPHYPPAREWGKDCFVCVRSREREIAGRPGVVQGRRGVSDSELASWGWWCMAWHCSHSCRHTQIDACMRLCSDQPGSTTFQPQNQRWYFSPTVASTQPRTYWLMAPCTHTH